MREPSLRIAAVNTARPLAHASVGAMNVIRFVRMSEALARRGHRVDLVVPGDDAGLSAHARVRQVSPDHVRWQDYDVVTTELHSGFAALRDWGGADHPHIVATLGSVVAPHPIDGVYFYGAVLDQLWATQQEVAARARAVAVLTQPSIDLWHRVHGHHVPVLRVPCGVDADVPPPRRNPYRDLGISAPVAIFAGNIYARERQPEVNRLWQDRLNALGSALLRRGVRLVAMGPGDTDRLDPHAVTHVGVIDFREFWAWQWHADVGVVLAQGARQDNESSKIYYYLRTGLPVACEAPVPNASLIVETGHGAVVPYQADDANLLADAVADLAHRQLPREAVIAHMVAQHSWDTRADCYAPVLARSTAVG